MQNQTALIFGVIEKSKRLKAQIEKRSHRTIIETSRRRDCIKQKADLVLALPLELSCNKTRKRQL